ncbi:MAG: agmatinase family protein [Planctomycetes bacterium]|nr:agmatinase family protein [Planctomycetota bacterium]
MEEPHGQQIFGLESTRDASRVLLLPAPFDATTSYRRGTENGPRSIFEESFQVDLYDRDFGSVYQHGIWLDDEPSVIRQESRFLKPRVDQVVGGQLDDLTRERTIERIDLGGARVNRAIHDWTVGVLDQGKLPGVLGGEHSIAFGSIAACARRFPGLGILHVDAHADLRHAYQGFRWSHASIMDNVLRELPEVSRLVQVGIRDFSLEEQRRIASDDRITTWFDGAIRERTLDGDTFASITRAILDALPDTVYVSFDVDGLDPTLCPDTGTPVPGGLSFAEMRHLLAALARSGKRIVGFDLNEVSPAGGVVKAGDWNGNVGARVLYLLIGCAVHATT